MSDLLSAASLFLAVFGLLYGAWYGEIREALTLEVALKKADRKPNREKVYVAYRRRAAPLLIGAATVSSILFPDFVRTVLTSVRAYSNCGVYAFKSYDAVGTLFCAIWIMTMSFAIHIYFLAKELHRRLAKMDQE